MAREPSAPPRQCSTRRKGQKVGRGKGLDSVSQCAFSRLKGQRGRGRKARKNWKRSFHTLAAIRRWVEVGGVDQPQQGLCVGCVVRQ